MASNNPVPSKSEFLEHQVTHYKQRYNWDCGVTCVLMVLAPEQQQDLLENFSAVCQEEGFGQSTWTIDLCYLLKRYNVKHCMYTTMLGVNEDNRRHSYYDKILDLDRARVRRRFEQAESRGIAVRAQALGAAALEQHVRRAGPAVVLVDAGLLVCDLCKHNKLKAEFRRCFGGSYKGHYVLVTGARRGKLLYRDPALRERTCAAPAARLLRAAAAPGTDRDVILLHVPAATAPAAPAATATDSR